LRGGIRAICAGAKGSGRGETGRLIGHDRVCPL
jgi:hypothetical protein